MLKQNISTPINEDTMLHALVGLEMYIDECKRQGLEPSDKIVDAQKILNKIWYQMKTDENYYLFSEPF